MTEDVTAVDNLPNNEWEDVDDSTQVWRALPVDQGSSTLTRPMGTTRALEEELKLLP
jgi:hypothetical protein